MAPTNTRSDAIALAEAATLERDAAMARAVDLQRLANARGMLSGGSGFTEAKQAEYDQALTEAAAADNRRERYERIASNPLAVKVRSEAMTYRPDSRNSWFGDMAAAKLSNDPDAKQRLAAHKREIAVELEIRDRSTAVEFRRSVDRLNAETRTNPNRTDGTGGYEVPPLWLIDMAAVQVASGRPIANAIGSVPLPDGTNSINIPIFTTGMPITMQAADAGGVASTDITDTSVAAPVVTLEAEADVSQQLLDQVPVPGLDGLLYRSAMAGMNALEEAQIVNGSGANGQFQGLIGLSGAATVAYTDASPTPAEAYIPTLKALAAVSNNRDLPAQAVFMRGGRWAWFGSAVTSDGLLQNGPGRGYMADMDGLGVGDITPIGPFNGYPTFIDQAIPVNLGAGTNQDAIIVTRPTDHALWEGVPRMRVMVDVLSGTLQARIQTFRYAAFTGGIYPTATAIVAGTGLIVQSGY